MSNKFNTRKLHLLIEIFIVLWLNAGNFTYIGEAIPSVAKFGAFIIWIALGFYQEKSFLKNWVNNVIFLLLFVLIILIGNLIGNEDYYSLFFQNYLYVFIITSLYSYRFYFGNKDEIVTILTVLILDIVIVTVHTYIELLDNPLVARALSTGSDLQEQLLGDKISKGLGGYALCYQLVFFSAFVMNIHTNRKSAKLLKYAVYMGILLFLFQAQITLALIMHFILIFIIVLCNKNDKKSSWIIKLVIIVITGCVALNIQNILDMAINISSNELAQRLAEVRNFLITRNADEGDLGSRMKLYTVSLKSFTDNPLIGTFGTKPFGNHSTFLDILGVYGLLGIIGIAALLRPMMIIKKNLKDR